jgi:HEAT repeat protein
VIKTVMCAACLLLGLAAPVSAYIDASPTLGRVVRESTNIVVLRVEKASKDKGVIIYSKVEDLKGKDAADQIKHRITEGWHPGEAKLIFDWAEPGRIAICFYNGRSAVTCIGNYWYGASAAESPWWTMTCGEARLGYAYFGSVQKLRGHLKAMLAGKEAVITVVQFHEDRQKVLKQRDVADFKNVFRGRDFPIARIKASLKMTDHPGEIKAVEPGAGGREDVPPLIESLESKDGHVRAEAAEELGLIGPIAREAIPALLRRLKDSEGMVRVKAADALARIDSKNPAALPAVIAALKDESEKVRRAAAEALGGFGPAANAAVPTLIEALKDVDPNVRWAAADALRDIGPEAKTAIVPLIEALKDEHIRSAAAEALGGIGREAKAAIPPLEAALKDQKPEMRRAAAWSLLQIDSSNDDRTTAAVMILIGGLEDHYLTLELLRRVSFVYNKTAGVFALTKLLKSENVNTRWMAARILGENGPGAKPAVPALIETLKDKERSPRIWTTIALASIGPEAKAAIPALTEASKNDEVDQVRWYAAVALVKIASEKAAAPLLIEALNGPKTNDDYLDVRRRAAEALGQLGPAGKVAVPALMEALNDKKYFDIRAAAATALGQIGPDAKAAIAALTAALKDKDESVRRAAAEAIKKIGQK